MTIDEIVAAVAEAVPRLGATRLVAVDGPGGAGKSTLAEQLSAACGATLLHTDDFASWDDQFDWWARFEQQVLEQVRLARGLDRDGPQALPRWEQWMSAEDLHFAADRTRNHADVVVDGQRPWE
ncbi:AAA family ATPase [Nocardia asteroides]|uniref:AAA family ATPase n=1 Tax=Nocardia asteroides TaxID=1824 RepID=UPI0037AEA5AA